MNYEINEINEFIENCDEYDINEIIKLLVSLGFIKYNAMIDRNNGPRGFDENLYENALVKLHGKWNRISKKEEEQIIKIANRF